MTNLDSILKRRDITLPTKVCLVKAMVFPVVMYECELDHKEGWRLKNWCFQIVEGSSESLGLQAQPVLKEINPEYIGRIDAEAETPILWPPDAKSQIFGKDPSAGKDWGQEKKGTAEDEMVR